MVGYDEISLSQSFVTLKGYVDAIQLVMISAVPPLKEVVVQNEHAVVIESDSETETTSKDHMDMYTYTGIGDIPPLLSEWDSFMGILDIQTRNVMYQQLFPLHVIVRSIRIIFYMQVGGYHCFYWYEV